MEIKEIKALKWKLGRYLRQFGECIYSKNGRAHFRTYVEGQLGPLERKSIEPIADAAGVSPRTLQEFLYIHTWDEDGVRDKVQEIVKRDFKGEEKIGIIDETTFPKKGKETACVKRQYCGALGKVENCVTSIHLAFASGDFHTLIDSDLFLPEDWAADEKRRKKVGIRETLKYRPFYRIALDQIEHAMGNGIRFDWATADERYGDIPAFSQRLEEFDVPYVLEVKRTLTGWAGRKPSVWENASEAGEAGSRLQKFPRLANGSIPSRTVENFAHHGRTLRKQPWVPYRLKDTNKGPEVWEVKSCLFYMKRDGRPSRELSLIVMRNVLNGEIKYFVAWNPNGAPIETLLRVAFSRWRVERCFQDEKTEIGMDHFEVRRFLSVKRHLVLSMVSHLFLAQQKVRHQRGGGKSGPHALPAQRRHEYGHQHTSPAPGAKVCSAC